MRCVTLCSYFMIMVEFCKKLINKFCKPQLNPKQVILWRISFPVFFIWDNNLDVLHITNKQIFSDHRRTV